MNLPEKNDRLLDEVERLQGEAERLRELLEGFADDMVTLGEDWEHLLAEVEKEENAGLRELVAAGKNDRKEIDELVDENLRLRGLLKGVVDEMVIGEDWEHLLATIKGELGE